MNLSLSKRAILIVVGVAFFIQKTGWADEPTGAVQVIAAPGQRPTPQAIGGPGMVPPGTKPGSGPPGTVPGTPGGGKPGENKGDSPKEDAADDKVIRRGAIVIEKGDRSELDKAALGEDGRVAFEFRNQGWPELVEWLSDLSQQPFDWLELPADRVNITTPGRYTVLEVTDLFNRHLLSRGYTMLALDGGMTVVKCSAINPAIVPRVSPDQLGSVPPHSFVRTSLNVGWLSAEKLAEELKAMISENGKLTALTTTNRIEAMDAAITLKQVAELLAMEQDINSRESLAPEFKLRHIPAIEAKRLLEQFLGVSNKPEPKMTPEQMQQMQQMQMRMQQGGKPPTPEPPKPDISVVANTRQNSILIKAPPDRVAIATEFLKRIDVPGATMSSLADVQSRVEVFRLVSLDPEKLIEIVQEMNVLEPSTNIRVDSENRALIVSGSAADRFIIQQIITRLDGSGRKFEVLQLRRLEANDVAESIAFLMGMDEKKEDNSRQRYPYFFGGGDDKKKKEDKFRVAANTRFRQVLLWANESEMNEVSNLLIKLGELPPPTGNNRNIRVINADINPETFRYLKGLERQWQQIAPNPLLLPEEDRFKEDRFKNKRDEAETKPVEATQSDFPASESQPKENDFPLKSESRADDHDTVSTRMDARQLTATFAQNDTDSSAAQSSPHAKEIRSVDDFEREFMPSIQKPIAKAVDGQSQETGFAESSQVNQVNQVEPIRIELDAAGNLVISSRDTAALDRLEDVMLQFSPPKRAYHTFTTQYTSATWVKLNLEDFFKEEDDKKNDSNNLSRWFFGFDSEDDDKKGPSGLGRSAKLRFIADVDTGTIVVSNASAEQLKTIEELIQLWDVPEPVNNRRVRYTRLVSLKFGRAGKIAETIKETYRDLLSSNDKAFQQPVQGGQGGGGNQVPKANAANARSGGSELVDMGGSGQQGGGADFSFKGKLSLGIDELGNTLLVSAEGDQLLKLVCDMIDQLDQAAKSSDGVRIVNLPASIHVSSLEMALRTLQSGTQQSAPTVSNGQSPSSQRGGPGINRPAANRSPSPGTLETTDG